MSFPVQAGEQHCTKSECDVMREEDLREISHIPADNEMDYCEN